MEGQTMDNDTAVKLAEVDQRARNNTRRIEKLEEVQDEIRSLATSTAVMAQRLGEVENHVDEIKVSVKTLEGKPGKRWENFAEKLIWLVVGGCVAYALMQIGINV